MEKTIAERLSDAIDYAITEGVADQSQAGAGLLAAAAEALGALKTYDGKTGTQVMYDMAMLAAGAGCWPDHFDPNKRTKK